jgi:hypothetical protein
MDGMISSGTSNRHNVMKSGIYIAKIKIKNICTCQIHIGSIDLPIKKTNPLQQSSLFTFLQRDFSLHYITQRVPFLREYQSTANGINHLKRNYPLFVIYITVPILWYKFEL